MRYRDQRFPSDNELTMIHGDEVHRVQLVNISGTGARLGDVGPLPRDALVTLCHLHVRILARVAWSNDRRTGVHFTVPLSTADMNALRGAVRGHRGWGSSSDHSFRELR